LTRWVLQKLQACDNVGHFQTELGRCKILHIWNKGLGGRIFMILQIIANQMSLDFLQGQIRLVWSELFWSHFRVSEPIHTTDQFLISGLQPQAVLQCTSQKYMEYGICRACICIQWPWHPSGEATREEEMQGACSHTLEGLGAQQIPALRSHQLVPVIFARVRGRDLIHHIKSLLDQCAIRQLHLWGS